MAKPDLCLSSPVLRRFKASALPFDLEELGSLTAEVLLWGELPPGPRVGIVGTRAPSRRGALSAFHLARSLARAGVTVVSGGAVGIDSAAHLGALAGGGRSLVVAPVWLERAYPKKNRPLFDAILRRGGGYLTVSDENAPLLPFVFFRRNEALVTLCDSLVLGECPKKSGARNAMLHARKLNRERYVIAYGYGEEQAEGSHQELMRGGAELLHQATPLVRSLGSVQAAERKGRDQLCGPSRPSSAKRILAKRKADLRGSGVAFSHVAQDPIREAIVTALGRGARTVEEICYQSQLAPSVVQHQLLLFTLEGVIDEDDTGLLRYHGARYERS